MFETIFTHASATPLPANVAVDRAIPLLHDFETVIKLSPDCRGCKRLPPQKTGKGQPSSVSPEREHYEVEDDLPFMPKKLWSGGVRYMAEFLPTEEGCIITVHAPGGFTSANHWRILHETIAEDKEPTLERVRSKDLMHTDAGGGTWYVEIASEAKCNMTFVAIVKGFLKNSHTQLQNAFIEKLKVPPTQRARRPTVGRRRSSVF